MELSKSLWLCQRARPLGDDHAFGPQYLAVVPDENCLVVLFPIGPSRSGRSFIHGYALRYEGISTYEIRILHLKLVGASWQTALLFEDADYLHWFEPRDGKSFNMFASKVPWSFLEAEYLESFHRLLSGARSLRLNRSDKGG